MSYRDVLNRVLELFVPRTVDALRKARVVAHVQAINPPFKIVGWKGLEKVFATYAYVPWTIVLIPRENDEIEVALLIPMQALESGIARTIEALFRTKVLTRKELEELSVPLTALDEIKDTIVLCRWRDRSDEVFYWLPFIAEQLIEAWKGWSSLEPTPIPVIAVVYRDKLTEEQQNLMRLSSALKELALLTSKDKLDSSNITWLSPILVTLDRRLILNEFPSEAVEVAMRRIEFVKIPVIGYARVPQVDEEVLRKVTEIMRRYRGVPSAIGTVFRGVKGLRYGVENVLGAIPSEVKLRILKPSEVEAYNVAGFYKPLEKTIVVRKDLPAIAVLVHEVAHSLDYKHDLEPSKELKSNPRLMEQAQLVSLLIGVRDIKHLTKPTELWAQSVEAYVFQREWLRKNFPELYEFVDRWLNKIAPSLVELSKELELEPTPEALEKLEKLAENIPRELAPLLLKPLSKLSDREKELLLRWGLATYGERFLEDVARLDPLARTTIQWFENPLAVDIEGVDTPNVLPKAEQLAKKIFKVVALEHPELVEKHRKLLEEEPKSQTSRKVGKPSTTIDVVIEKVKEISPKLVPLLESALRKKPSQLTEAEKRVLVLAKLLINPQSIGTDTAFRSRRRVRNVESWLTETGVRGDIPGVDTPEMREFLKQLKKLLKQRKYREIEKLILGEAVVA